ncbi:hypothetical protein OHA70_10930 [Kribbella sp. NBC_00382]|uniref:ATP-grasp domain-containing protein n=1 Tax=Kribbella sp. NBC_00382 TaxID=2975967 RepID=UPI002E1E7C68
MTALDPPTVAVVHAPFAAASLREILVAAGSGPQVILFFRECVAARNPGLVEVCKRMLPVRVVTDDPRDVDLAGITAVLTFSDHELEFADQLTARLAGSATTGTPIAGADVWSKSAQRRTLRDTGLSKVTGIEVRTPAELIAGVSMVGLPAFLKPIRGAGGAGVLQLRTADEVEAAARGLAGEAQVLEQAIPLLPSHPNVPWLGPLFSVEVSTNALGEHTVMTTFAKVPMQEVVVSEGSDGALQRTVRVCGDVHPAFLDDIQLAELHERCCQALTALGVRGRVTHTELLATGDGFEVVEVNGRMGGFLNRLLGHTSGLDLVRSALETAAGRPLSTADVPTGSVALGYFPGFRDLRGTVRGGFQKGELTQLAGVRSVEWVAATGAARSDGDGRLCNVVLSAGSEPELHDGAAAVTSLLDASFTADGGLPGFADS